MDQQELIARLAAGEAFGGSVPERIDTHISVILLTADRAFKLRRALKTSYLDYTTLARRKAGCDREIALNRRTAPDLYLRAVPVTQGTGGHLMIDGDGAAIEWLVEMQRFDPESTLDRHIAEKPIETTLLCAIADQCAQLHQAAQRMSGPAFACALERIVRGSREELFASGGTIFSADEIEELTRRQLAGLNTRRKSIDARDRSDRIRECHGDLHLGNICLHDGHPLIFDAIEFNPDFNRMDVFYDIAFLLMDLWVQGDRAGANAVLNRYVYRTSDYSGLSLLPLYQSMRATIRAHVLAKSACQTDDTTSKQTLVKRARRYFDAARALLSIPSPMLVAVGGYSGTGKSTLAYRTAPNLDPPPGAVVLSSDLLRKRRFGVEPNERLAQSHYAEEISDLVYEELLEAAAETLQEDWPVILDATFMKASGRIGAERLSAKLGVPFRGFWLTGTPRLLSTRITDRQQGPSDATPDVLRRQLAADPGDIDWTVLDTTDPQLDTGSRVQRELGLMAGAA